MKPKLYYINKRKILIAIGIIGLFFIGVFTWYIIDLNEKTKQCVEAADELSQHFRIENGLPIGDSVSGSMACLDLMYNPNHDIAEEIEKRLKLQQAEFPQIIEINSADKTTKIKIYIPNSYRDNNIGILLDNVALLHKHGGTIKAKAVYAYYKDDNRYILEFEKISTLEDYTLSFSLNGAPFNLEIFSIIEN